MKARTLLLMAEKVIGQLQITDGELIDCQVYPGATWKPSEVTVHLTWDGLARVFRGLRLGLDELHIRRLASEKTQDFHLNFTALGVNFVGVRILPLDAPEQDASFLGAYEAVESRCFAVAGEAVAHG